LEDICWAFVEANRREDPHEERHLWKPIGICRSSSGWRKAFISCCAR
jgi:hypothetical protein